ncbi:MAG: hypothetical protein HY304_03470, partial [candidate division Zixibacteria bacterium]|nr:hypothetical protein [candidate division Zixibacteria bacterium]
MKTASQVVRGIALLFLLALGTEVAMPGWYLDSMKDTKILEIRGETADSTKLGKDRYIVDNLDYVLAHHEWVVVNFSAYWCGDSHRYLPDYQKAAALPEYAGIFWTYAEIDGTVGNENFRSRFNLPGI